jgi:hypothetical protein
MTSARPLFLIDVDGVLNPFAARRCPPGFSEHQLDGYRVYLAAAHGEWLRGLAADFELAWATTWERKANLLIGPLLGLPLLPVISIGRDDPGPSWKLPSVDRFVGERPFAWVDDDLFSDARAWAKKRSAPTLLLSADPAVGLTKAHVEKARRFAARLRSGARPLIPD